MPEDNGLTQLIGELQKVAEGLPDDISRKLILAAVLAGREETKSIRQRLRRIEKAVITLAGVVAFLGLVDVALHGEAQWAMNLLGLLR